MNVLSSTNEANLLNAGNSNFVIRCIELSCWCCDSVSKGCALLQKISPTPLRKIRARHSICLPVLGTQRYISPDHVLATGCVLILCMIVG
jgi:hypothetical protein